MKRKEMTKLAIPKSSFATNEYFYDERFIYAKTKDDGELLKLALFDDGFYKLRVFNGVPILEIDGLRMHLVKEFKTPLDYSKQVVKTLAIKTQNSRPKTVLDTCMGLGYTSIEAHSAGASVTTCEISRAVLTLAQWNPWSEKLFGNSGITIVEGDITKKIKDMNDCSFDAIIHDPPRFSKAGQLYSLEFYKQLYRVMKPGGRLFHYVGSVGKGKGRRIDEEVEKRLKEAGFGKIKKIRNLQGLAALR